MIRKSKNQPILSNGSNFYAIQPLNKLGLFYSFWNTHGALGDSKTYQTVTNTVTFN